jgi:hypothetical protein
MMADIYLSGPVLRASGPVATWVSSFYERVGELAGFAGAQIQYPISDLELEKAEPSEFYREIESRISDSHVAVVVFTGGDVSGSIEASIASQLGKPVLLVSDKPAGVPRILRGMPHVSACVHYEEAKNVHVERFFRQNLQRGFMSNS